MSDDAPTAATAGLNPKQRKFVAEYVLSLNAEASALAAGYSPKTAKSQGFRLLTHATIAKAIERGKQALEVRTEITQERVLAELALLAFSDVSHYEVDELGLNVKLAANAPRHAMRAISSIKRKTFTTEDGAVTREVEIKLWDKPGPLKLAGRHVGLFPDKVQIETKDDKPIAIIINGAMPIPHDVQSVIDVEPAVTGETTTTMGENR